MYRGVFHRTAMVTVFEASFFLNLGDETPQSALRRLVDDSYGIANCVASGKSPGGRELNTGKASAFRERLRIGMLEVICKCPEKL